LAYRKISAYHCGRVNRFPQAAKFPVGGLTQADPGEADQSLEPSLTSSRADFLEPMSDRNPGRMRAGKCWACNGRKLAESWLEA
jgi:hypothetical protein